MCVYLMSFHFTLSFLVGQIVCLYVLFMCVCVYLHECDEITSLKIHWLWHILCFVFISPKFTHFSQKFDAKNIEIIQRLIFIRKNRISSYWKHTQKKIVYWLKGKPNRVFFVCTKKNNTNKQFKTTTFRFYVHKVWKAFEWWANVSTVLPPPHILHRTPDID